MKSLLFFALLFFGFTKVYSQTTLTLDLKSLTDTSKIYLVFGKDTLKPEDNIKLSKEISEGFLKILAHGNTFKIKIENNAGLRAFIPVIDVNKDTSYKIVKDSFGDTKFDFGYNLSLQILQNNSDQTNLKTYTNIHIIIPDETTKEDNGACAPSNPFVDSAMLSSTNSVANCQQCARTEKLKNKSDTRSYTNYFIIYDASHKLDDYTICKSIVHKNKDSDKGTLRWLVKYRKVKAAWFAPSVGSSLTFEVNNSRVTDKFKIIVGDSDLFLNNTSFESVINNHLGATILASAAGNKPNGDSAKQVKNAEAEGKENLPTCEADSDRINRLYGELSEYVREFNLSACTVEANRHNMIGILSQIKLQFKLTGTDVLGQLLNKFKNKNQQSIASSVKDLISSLDSLKPLVYSTARLVNRDYINIKVVDGNNETVVDENIRTSFGLKIDYSAGVFLTGLRDDNFIFIDTTVRFSPDSATVARDTSGNFVRKQTSNNLNVGFGVLVHVYPRISSNYNLGLTTGFMATTNLDINILLGGSFMLQSLFGSNNRVAFNGGIAWGKVKRLSSAYQEGYHANPVVNPSNTDYSYSRPVFYATAGDPTIQVWKRSWFFGITFNFK